MTKQIQVKPSFYAYNFYELKRIAFTYGYNLVLHGSMNRDLDLIAIPWQEELLSYEDMIKEFTDYLGGYLLSQDEHQINCFPHGRKSYVINLNRTTNKDGDDAQYYIDISIIPTVKKPEMEDTFRPMIKGKISPEKFREARDAINDYIVKNPIR